MRSHDWTITIGQSNAQQVFTPQFTPNHVEN